MSTTDNDSKYPNIINDARTNGLSDKVNIYNKCSELNNAIESLKIDKDKAEKLWGEIIQATIDNIKGLSEKNRFALPALLLAYAKINIGFNNFKKIIEECSVFGVANFALYFGKAASLETAVAILVKFWENSCLSFFKSYLEIFNHTKRILILENLLTCILEKRLSMPFFSDFYQLICQKISRKLTEEEIKGCYWAAISQDPYCLDSLLKGLNLSEPNELLISAYEKAVDDCCSLVISGSNFSGKLNPYFNEALNFPEPYRSEIVIKILQTKLKIMPGLETLQEIKDIVSWAARVGDNRLVDFVYEKIFGYFLTYNMVEAWEIISGGYFSGQKRSEKIEMFYQAATNYWCLKLLEDPNIFSKNDRKNKIWGLFNEREPDDSKNSEIVKLLIEIDPQKFFRFLIKLIKDKKLENFKTIKKLLPTDYWETKKPLIIAKMNKNDLVALIDQNVFS